ncbi:MAG: efflux transporter outer membrane subunit [Betaproteobacteria bacterium]|nr:MAG: efflux transporter outer membrane subunit [Betaproteobacteria bacterium]
MSKRRTPIVAASATITLLAGCISLAPSYQRPAAPVAASFPSAASAPLADPAAADIEWQRYFTEPRLQRLIAIALADNRDLRIAVLNIEQARALYQVRRADELPTIGVGAAGSRAPGTNGRIANTYSVGFAVTGYELDLFGRIRNLSEAALAQYVASEEARKTAQISLVAAVATTHLSLLADDALLAVTRQTLATREESFKLTRLKFDNGAASELDLRLAESLLEAAKVALAQQTRQRAVDEDALTLLLGQPLPADLPPQRDLLVDAGLPELPAGVPSEVLTRRPDVRQAEQQLIAAHANIGAARAAFFPRVTLTGTAGTASSELSGLFKSGSFAWTFAPQALLTVFDAGRNQANLDVARVNRDIALAQYERAIQTAFREVADSLAGRATLGEQLRAQLAQAHAEEVRVRLTELRYRNGASSSLEVLDAQRTLFAAQQAVIQLQAQQLQNLVTLYKVLGGGWKD